MDIKKLGFGLMRLPHTDENDDGSIDMDLFKKLVDRFMEEGFTYFDTAYMYCNSKSEEAFKEAVVKRYPRESFTLTDKLPFGWLSSFEDRDKVFEEQLNRTGVDYFDYYWLHNVNVESIKIFEKYDCFGFIQNKKKEGKVRHIGFSYHDRPEALDRILTMHPEIEFVQIQFNWLDYNSGWVQSAKNYEVIAKHGKKAIVMEPLKGGKLANVTDEIKKEMLKFDANASPASWGIRFAASRENVMVVLSGMNSMEQMEDNISYMKEFKPLSPEENKMLISAADIMNKNIAIQCTGCSYCTVNCPKNIATPRYFALYNTEKSGVKSDTKQPKSQASIYYYHYAEEYGKASDCIGCGKCEKACPQHLPIREYLKMVASVFEDR